MGACNCRCEGHQQAYGQVERISIEPMVVAAQLPSVPLREGDKVHQGGADTEQRSPAVLEAKKQRFARTAVVFMGYQQDFFGVEGKLHNVIEASAGPVLEKTLAIIEALKGTSVLLLQTPTIFSEDYHELAEPRGILKLIVQARAFRASDPGSETMPQLTAYGQRILQVSGKRSLNAFMGTCLERLLRDEGVTDVVLCGALTSVCIDSTGRAAHELGFRVHQLTDCCCGRTEGEQAHYFREVFPLYAEVLTSRELLTVLEAVECGRSYTPPASFDPPMRHAIPAALRRPFERTAVIMIGYQHDYFGADGRLHQVIEAASECVLANTIKLLDALKDTSVLLIQTPIIFTADYRELEDPSGILKAIKDLGAFADGDPGSLPIPEIEAYGQRILRVPGKRGLNAFTGTCLGSLLQMERVSDVVFCGAVTSICIDSTGRTAHELGYRVHQLSDCSCGRTAEEQRLFCEEIFPLYAHVTTTETLLGELLAAELSSEVPPCPTSQGLLDDMNLQASEDLDLDGRSGVDEESYREFEQRCSLPHLLSWMRRHPQEAVKLRHAQDELSVQIQHRLVDHAAAMRKKYEEMEQQVATDSAAPADLEEDVSAPLVTFLSHGKDEAGSLSRLLKLMLRRVLRVRCGQDMSAPRVFLDSDDIYSQSELRRSVEECKVLTLILTTSTFFRPWIICEFVTAWRMSVPVVLVEVLGSGFAVTNENAEEQIRKHVDNGTIDRVKQYCANMTHEVLVECCRALLTRPRVTIDPRESTSAQWASVCDLAKVLMIQARMESPRCLELTTQDPARDFLVQAAPDQDYAAYITYHHTQENVVVARILKLMIEDQLAKGDLFCDKVFLDADSLFDLSSLVSHVERSGNLILLLTNDVLHRPWVIIELVHAVRNAIPLLPVPIVRDFDFRAFICNKGTFSEVIDGFDEKAKALFQREGIRVPEIRRALKQLFNVIAQPFYGHCSETVQRAQIFEIMRRLSSGHGEGPVMRQSSSQDSSTGRHKKGTGMMHVSVNAGI